MHTISRDKTYLPPSVPWNESDIPAICIKVEQSREETVETLTWCVLEDGAKVDRVIVNPETKKETTALERAVDCGQEETVRLLLKNRAHVNLPNKSNENKSLVHVAAEKRHLSTLKLLIEHGALVNTWDETDSTPLHYAIRSNQTPVAKILLDAGADIHTFNKEKKSPVTLAVDLRNTNLLRLLLEYNKSNKTYLHELAVEVERSENRQNSMDIKILLVRHGQGLSYAEKSLLISPHQVLADTVRRKFHHS